MFTFTEFINIKATDNSVFMLLDRAVVALARLHFEWSVTKVRVKVKVKVISGLALWSAWNVMLYTAKDLYYIN